MVKVSLMIFPTADDCLQWVKFEEILLHSFARGVLIEVSLELFASLFFLAVWKEQWGKVRI